ncbi:SLBB domain-containing protein [candidate division KSB1 bacterium]|nr:SLBB domain-containing protein [candidate division KSB1 bacterium]
MKIQNHYFIDSQRLFPILLVLLMAFAGKSFAQGFDDETEWRKQSSLPTAVDFSKLFESEETAKEDFEDAKRKRESDIQTLMSKPAALEKAIDPDNYIVGPGDVFSFNIWGAMEMQIPVVVSPEGKLSIPSVGEVDVDGLSLSKVKSIVLEQAKPFYEKSEISLSLEMLRYFRVHVVGAVQYPGTYVANPTSRISELIEEAGGISGWANTSLIELRKENGDTAYFNLSIFKATGDLSSDLFVHGGDVIFVPPIDLASRTVIVEGDFKKGGRYPILENENIYDFLLRIGPFSRSANLSEISVIRRVEGKVQIKKPFASGQEKMLLENDDRVVIPSEFVYVKGAVQNPGAYPFVANLTARDYAGMAGGSYQSTNIKGVKVYNRYTGKTRKGPETLIEAGDVVDLPQSWGNRVRDLAQVVSAIASVFLAAKAIGLLEK